MPGRSNHEVRTHCAILDRLRLALPPVAQRTLMHLPLGEDRRPETGALLKRMGARAGAADLLLIWNGIAHFIEVKTGDRARGIPKTYQSPEQRQFQADVEAAGARYGIARSSDDAIALCRSWGVPIREVALSVEVAGAGALLLNNDVAEQLHGIARGAAE